MCGFALAMGLAATRGLTWPCDVDLYRDIGFAQSIRDGHLLADPLYRGEWLWYPPLVPGLIALASLFSGLPVHHAATQLGVYLNLLAPLGFYLLTARLLGRRVGAAATFSFLFIGIGDYPTWAAASYSPWLWPGNFVQGLFYLGMAALHRALIRKRGSSTLMWLITGALLGLCALGHSAPALILGGVAAFCTVHLLVRPGECPRGRTLLHFGLMLAVAFVVALPYTYSILFHYGMDVKNQAPSSWTYIRLDLHMLPRFWADLLAPALLLPLIGYFGVIILGRLGAWTRALILYWLVGTVALLSYSYLHQWLKTQGISAPMAVPGHNFHLYLKALEAMFVGCALVLGGRLLAWIAGAIGRRLQPGRSRRGLDHAREVTSLLAVLALVFALVYPVYLQRNDFTGDRQKAEILTPNKDMAEIFRWIQEHTSADDVFLADDDLSLHLVSPAGRKVVAMIPFFSNPFVPWEERHEARANLFTALVRGEEMPFQPLAKRYKLDYLLEKGALAVKIYGSSMPFLEVAHRAGPYWLLKVKRRKYNPDYLPPH